MNDDLTYLKKSLTEYLNKFGDIPLTPNTFLQIVKRAIEMQIRDEEKDFSRGASEVDIY